MIKAPSLFTSKTAKYSAFKQQQLPAWKPTLNAKTVITTLIITALLFIFIGIGMLIISNNIQEKVIEYTDCRNDLNQSCAILISQPQWPPFKKCRCVISFELEKRFTSNVFIYYSLSRFFQNHRTYLKSKDDAQLAGASTSASLSSDCNPYRYTNSDAPIAPCGAIPNSIFNDTFQLFYQPSSNVSIVDDDLIEVKLLRRGIAWPSDINKKFKNPPGPTIKKAFKGTSKPVNWPTPVWNLDPNDAENNGYVNEDLVVWMRSSAFSTFRKLHRRVDHDFMPSIFKSGLPKGQYLLHINYIFPVTAFSGSKFFIMSTVSWIGGKNKILGILYIVTGSLCIFSALLSFFVHRYFSTSKITNLLSNSIDLSVKT